MKSGKLFPAHFCRRGKLNHKLSNEVKLESTIALYSPSRFTFHDGAALSHHHFSNPIDFYFSSSPDCFSSISDIFQCQRFVLERRRSLLLGQTFHSPKLTLLPCQIKNSLYFFYEINSQSNRRYVSRVAWARKS